MIRIGKVLTIASLALIVTAGLGWAGDSNDQLKRVETYGGLAVPTAQMAPEGAELQSIRAKISPDDDQRQSLGIAGSPASPAASEVVDYTYDDYQYRQKGRRVDYDLNANTIFTQTSQYTEDPSERYSTYNRYEPVAGFWPMGVPSHCFAYPHANGTQASTIAIAPDGRILLAGEVGWKDPGNYLQDIENISHWQFDQSVNCFFQSQQIPQAQYSSGFPVTSRLRQPIVQIQEYAGDTVIHLIAVSSTQHLVSGTSNVYENVVQYFRKTAFDYTASWSGPVTIDSSYWSAELAASRVSGKVAVVYTHHSAGGIANDNHYDNEVYYRESTNGGLTWGSPQNITNYNRSNRSYNPWYEVSPLYTSNDDLIIVFNATSLPSDPYSDTSTVFNAMSSSMFCWSSSTGNVVRMHDFEFTMDEQYEHCGRGGYNTLSIAYFQVSECNGRLYTAFVKWNDPDNANPNDCSVDDGSHQGPLFGGNGEIYLTICPNLDGATWDYPRNLTQTYTPGCTSGNCLSETKLSMAAYGVDSAAYGQTLYWPENVIDLNGGYTGSHYLHLFYLEDLHPSEAVYGEGHYTYSPLKWARLACIPADNTPSLYRYPREMVSPDTIYHGDMLENALIICNDGNAGLSYNLAVEEVTGPSGWLSAAYTSGSGLNDCDSIPIYINNGGLVNSPPSPVSLVGRVIITSNAPTSPDTMKVEVVVSGTNPGNTQTGTDVVVNSSSTTVTFPTVTMAGNTTFETGFSGPDGLSAYQLIPTSQPVYYYIETDAVYSGMVEICMAYNPADVTGDESLLKMLHYDEAISDWVDITSSVDTVANIVCGLTADLSPFVLAIPESGGCCVGLTGNVDNDIGDIVDIGDLTALINYLFIPPFPVPVCMEEANVDGTGTVDIGDLTALINYLFIPPFPAPAPCQ